MIKFIVMCVIAVVLYTLYTVYTLWVCKKQEEEWYDICYYQMDRGGHTHDDKCCGCVGGTKHTDYLSEDCIDCPYLDLSL